jgi:hypothetical protein
VTERLYINFYHNGMSKLKSIARLIFYFMTIKAKKKSLELRIRKCA